MIEPYDLTAKDDGEDQPQSRDDQVGGLYEPEGLDVKEDVTDRPSTYGGDEADDVGAEPVEALPRC